MNEQQMQQLLAFMQQQMEAQQQGMADLPQRAMQAGATPTQGSGGTILSPDPVRRLQQSQEEWDLKFPGIEKQAARLRMTPEALQASRGMDAQGQWAMLGQSTVMDPQKLRQVMRDANAYREAAAATREGRQGVASEIPASQWEQGANYRVGPSGAGSVAADGTRTITSPYGTASMGPQGGAQVAQAAPQAPAAPTPPTTAGVPSVPVGDIFSGAGNAVVNAAQSATDAYRDAVMPDAPVNTTLAPPVEGSGLRRGVIQGLSFIPNMLLGAGSTIAEMGNSIFGNQVDIPGVNLEADFMSNLKNVFGASQDSRLVQDPNSPVGLSFQAPQGPIAPGFAGPAYQAGTTSGSTPSLQANPYTAPGMTPESRQQGAVTVGANERNPFNPPAAAQPTEPNFFNQIPGFGQGQTNPLSPEQTRNMFMTEEERKRRQTNQPMFAGR